MSKLTIDQKNIKALFSDKKADFLIPDYQRPYAWTDNECETLWDDIFTFAFPDNDFSKFDSDNDEYFLGPIVTFKNENNKLEIIDGQQRLTTLLLLLRAFFDRFANMKDANSVKTREEISKCIWKTDEFGTPLMDSLKIDSEVATDDQKEEFLSILRTGSAENKKSKYAKNFDFFVKKIDEFLESFPSYFSYLPTRILNNCIILPIEAESQDTALRIFSTLNDRGLPLSDSDIFKAQFYKYYTSKGKKNDFINKWKYLEEVSERIFHPTSGSPMDELFTRYMYFERAKQGNKSSTTEALRKFYEKDSYALLKNDETIENLKSLVDFWDAVSRQDDEIFNNKILRQLYVLNYAPNGMWYYFVSVYYMQNKDKDGKLDEIKFSKFLDLITAFIWTYAVVNPGVNALRTPVYAEMINIVNGAEVTFKDYRFDINNVRTLFDAFGFYNPRPITKSMLTWWAYLDENQELLPLDTVIEIEHIYAKKRNELEQRLNDGNNLEKLGNKAILEKRINIRASDYRFKDKVLYYKGRVDKHQQLKEGTKNNELLTMANTLEDYTESNIISRDKKIIESFLNFVVANGLIANLSCNN